MLGLGQFSAKLQNCGAILVTIIVKIKVHVKIHFFAGI